MSEAVIEKCPDDVPTYDDMFNPLLDAMKKLGGSGSIVEIENKVAEVLELSDDAVSARYKGNETHFNYRLAWGRTYLKQFGLLENSKRGVWALTEKGKNSGEVNKQEVNKFVRELARKSKPKPVCENEETADMSWEEALISAVQKIEPAAFEKLCQRILREAGFVKVEVTGRSGDGGIDGKGIMQMAGFLSFHIIFQCKRYQGSVSSQQVRDFRGAMVGRADKGLIITTGTFTRGAVEEATRDGAPPIDLVDGDMLAEKMKEFRLGVSVETVEVEEVKVNEDWIRNF